MQAKTQPTARIAEDHRPSENESPNQEDVLRFKKRMLEWPNPVEYVNNMYGCHPDDDDTEYFKAVFAK